MAVGPGRGEATAVLAEVTTTVCGVGVERAVGVAQAARPSEIPNPKIQIPNCTGQILNG